MIPSIEKLPKIITIKDCVFTDDYRDRIFTNLILMDYDWMHYRIQAEIPFENKIVMLIEFLYIGSTDSYMTVEIEGESIQYVFSTDIFDKYFEKYLDAEKEAIHGEYAFSGEDIVLEFYNEVMANHKSINEKPTDKIIHPEQG